MEEVERIQCPECESYKIVPIIYGRPGRELADMSARDLVHLGGCVLPDDKKNMYCNDCKERWNIEDETYHSIIDQLFEEE